ncbi:MAG: FHA domain-containing protein [bacterium]
MKRCTSCNKISQDNYTVCPFCQTGKLVDVPTEPMSSAASNQKTDRYPDGGVGPQDATQIGGHVPVGAGDAELVIISQPNYLTKFQLREGRTCIGRDIRIRENASPGMVVIRLDFDGNISREHALIYKGKDDTSYRILDLMSKAGTYVNNEQAEKPLTLKDGDVLLIGVTELEFKQYKLGSRRVRKPNEAD